jgi:hypothetical protein
LRSSGAANPPGDEDPSGDFLFPGGGRGSPSRVDLPFGRALEIGRTIALVFGIGVAVLLLAVIAAAVRDRFARRAGGVLVVAAAAPPGAASGGASGSGGPPDPEALARDGLFAEAIRALLALAVDGVARRRGSAFSAALTSREVLARAALEGGSKEALRSLVFAVERCLFGGAFAGRAEFEAARAAARSLAP